MVHRGLLPHSDPQDAVARTRSVTRRRAGYTLVEMLLVVTIMGVLAMFAVPFGYRFVKHMQLWGATNTIKKQLQMARMRALADPYKHCGVYFKMTPTTSQSTQVFIESGTYNNAFDDPGVTDKIVAAEQPLPGGVTFSWDVQPSTADVIMFRGDGSAKYSGTLAVTDGLNTRHIDVLASTGRIKAY